MNSKITRWAGVIFGFALITLLISVFDADQILSNIQAVSLAVVAQVVSILFVTTLIGANAAFLLVQFAGAKLRFGDFLKIYWISWAIGLFVPGQVGDIASNTALLSREGLHWKPAIKYLFIDKLITLFIVACIAVLSISYLLWKVDISIHWAPNRIHLMLLFLAVIALLFCVVRVVYLKSKLFNTETGKNQKLPLYSPRFLLAILKNIFLTVVKASMTGFSYFLVLNAITNDYQNPILFMGLVMTSSLAGYIPITFSGIGTTEVFATLLISSSGLSGEIIVSVYLVMRGLTWAVAAIPAVLLGFLISQSRKQEYPIQ